MNDIVVDVGRTGSKLGLGADDGSAPGSVRSSACDLGSAWLAT